MRPGIVNLNDGRTLRPTEHLSEAWDSLGIRRLEPGVTERLASVAVEHGLYVLAGSGVGVNGSQEIALECKTAVTMPLGSELAITAGSDGLEFFHLTLKVPGA